MSIQTSLICDSATTIYKSIVAHEADIEGLDRAIGDGDHYLNVKRGAETIAGMVDELKNLAPDEAFNKIGMKLLSTIGGAAGPLFASLFMGMAKYTKEHEEKATELNHHLIAAATFAYGVQSMLMRGKSNVGEKTMLDVLVPASTTFTTAASQNKPVAEICHAVMDAADKGLEYTRDLIATKGRAAGLGERAIGHLDPGAKSCQVMIHAVCDLLLKKS